MERVTNLAEEVIYLTKTECEFMIERKICGETGIMKCDESSCHYEEKPIPQFNWMVINKIKTYRFHFLSRTILAEDENSNFFGTPYRASDLFCSLTDTIVIWSDSIIHVHLQV